MNAPQIDVNYELDEYIAKVYAGQDVIPAQENQIKLAMVAGMLVVNRALQDNSLQKRIMSALVSLLPDELRCEVKVSCPGYKAQEGIGLPEQQHGVHLWVYGALWKVQPELGQEVLLDHENIVSLDGPMCMWCEQAWSPERAQQMCEAEAQA